MMIQAVDGKKLPAILVFSKTLGYIKDLVLGEVNREIQYPNMAALWILTVPAIWSPAAKQVMRIAAEDVSMYSICSWCMFRFVGIEAPPLKLKAELSTLI